MQWLDVAAYFTRLRKDDHIVKIRYFTARWTGSKAHAQEAYLQAIQISPIVEVIYGKHQTQFTDCRVGECDFAGERRFFYEKEKRTDVNIAIHMVSDALKNECDRLVLVSGDSDLVPAVEMVKGLGKRVFVYVPIPDEVVPEEKDRFVATELRKAATMNNYLPIKTLDRAQFPDRIPDGKDGFIEKDFNW